MVSGITSNAAAAALPTAPDPKAAPVVAPDQLANKTTFLQLLVAQIKNQNPLSPSDGTQFLSQLAQFTQLEQSMSMNSELTSIHAILDKPATPTPPVVPATPKTAATA